MRTVLLILLLFCASTLLARPIEVVVGRGRNMNAVKLVDQAQAQALKGDLNGARKTVDAALAADATYWPALYIRAEILIEQHQYVAAIRDCEAILRQDSTVVEAALLRGEANYHLGNYAVAMKEADHCITIRPRQDALARAYNTRALLHLYCHDPAIQDVQKAIADATTACKLMAWSDGQLIDTLARAEAASGDFDAAAKHERQALGAKEVREDEKRRYEQHLALFQQHKTVGENSR
jgi:tetratricopeptide (TPR) repeat protein